MNGDDSAASVLFVCWGHSCRSVMAEALALQQFGSAVRFESAGLHPQPAEDAQAAIRTLRSEFGIVVRQHKPRSVNTLDLESYTHVVAMDTEVAEVLRDATDRRLIVWDVTDPWDGDSAGYRRCALEISKRLKSLPAISARSSGVD